MRRQSNLDHLQASPAPALPCGSSEEKHPIVNKDEPRMNTNSHECRRTHSNDKRHQNASPTLSPWNDFLSVVDNPSISVVTPPNQHLINPSIGVHSCPFVVRRFPWWMTLIGPSWIPLFLLSFFGCFRQAGLRGVALSALCCRRLRGSTWSYPFPWAYAHGYLLLPLRGSMGRPGVRPGTIKY